MSMAPGQRIAEPTWREVWEDMPRAAQSMAWALYWLVTLSVVWAT